MLGTYLQVSSYPYAFAVQSQDFDVQSAPPGTYHISQNVGEFKGLPFYSDFIMLFNCNTTGIAKVYYDNIICLGVSFSANNLYYYKASTDMFVKIS